MEVIIFFFYKLCSPSCHFYLLRSEDVGLNCLKISLLELDKISALNFSASKCSTPALAVLFPLLLVTLLTTDVSSSSPGITEQRIATFLPFETVWLLTHYPLVPNLGHVWFICTFFTINVSYKTHVCCDTNLVKKFQTNHLCATFGIRE